MAKKPISPEQKLLISQAKKLHKSKANTIGVDANGKPLRKQTYPQILKSLHQAVKVTGGLGATSSKGSPSLVQSKSNIKNNHVLRFLRVLYGKIDTTQYEILCEGEAKIRAFLFANKLVKLKFKQSENAKKDTIVFMLEKTLFADYRWFAPNNSASPTANTAGKFMVLLQHAKAVGVKASYCNGNEIYPSPKAATAKANRKTPAGFAANTAIMKRAAKRYNSPENITGYKSVPVRKNSWKKTLADEREHAATAHNFGGA